MAPLNSTSDSLPNPTNETTSIFLAPSNNIISLNNNDQLISINAAAQAPLKLTTTNYQSWQYQWETLLTAYDFLQFINEPPSTTAISVYKRQDHLIRSVMVASLSPEIIPFVTDDKTSYALWQNLATTYAKPSRARIMSLREDLNTIQKGNLSITVYLQKIKEICTKLASVGVHISVDKVFLHVVHGLPFEYDIIASALRARETAITLQELHDKLTDFEAHLTRRSSQTMAPNMANFAAKPLASTNRNSNRGTNNSRSNQRNFPPSNRNGNGGYQGGHSGGQSNRPRVTCQLCDKPGHHVKQCRKLLFILSAVTSTRPNGSSSNFNRSNDQQPKVNFAAQSTNADPNWLVDSSASHHVTQDLQNLSLHSKYDGSEDVMLGDGKSHKITHTGSTLLPSSSTPLNLSNVLCVPHMKKNLISVYKLCSDNHVSVDFSPYSFVVKDYCTGAPLVAGKPKGGVYPWPSNSTLEAISNAQVNTTSTTTAPI
ncbi:hypothetical protein KY285_035606 [Solanum tuberosum]|nr:hypothetical protein KY289_035835 [Solanum tuberosum]KAH0639020.1 hypothetical protein KY285_035606 [Solanum tuberosum]